MTNELKADTLYDIEDIEKQYQDLKLVYKVGKGEWADFLYYIPSKGVYIEKGPFGTHDAVCFKLCDFTDETGAREWKSRVESFWKTHYPKIKLDS
ncbi:MAG: hypothetical protein ACOH5I_15130 [Oligoflexus sp.]